MSTETLGPAPDAVIAAAARWVWFPPGTEQITTDDYRLTHFAGYSSVQWSGSVHDLDDVIDEAVAAATEAGSHRLRWWITDRTVPFDTPGALVARGFSHVETVEIMALGLRDARAVAMEEQHAPPGVEVVEVRDKESLRVADELGATVFEWPRLSEEQLDAEMAEIRAATNAAWHVRRYLALVDGVPAASAGVTLDGDALRLWGGATVPELRRRGAYRALVARRLLDGAGTGASFALVKAVDSTSAPILRRFGFETFGHEHCFQRPLP